MLSKTLISSTKSFIDADFKDFLEYIKTNEWATEKVIEDNSDELKLIHSKIYSLSLWDHELISSNSNKFLREIRSDGIASILLTLSGLRKQAALSLRGILEGTLKQIYYSEHPVEYKWLSDYSKYYLEWKDLIKYTNSRVFSNEKRLCNKISAKVQEIYFDLSKYIHASNPKYFSITTFMKAIEFDKDFFAYYTEKLDEVVNYSNALLVVFQWDEYKNFDSNTKSIIKKSISKEVYKLIMEPKE